MSASLHCRRCSAEVKPVLYRRGPHLRADCPLCRGYLKFVPKVAPWTQLVQPKPTPPQQQLGLFGEAS